MTMDEMVREILRLHKALGYGPSTEPVRIHAGKAGASAWVATGEPEAVHIESAGVAVAVAALRDRLRAKAAAAASEHEAKASAMRAALGERYPSHAIDDARVAWREYVAARDALMAARRGEGADVYTAEERLRYAGDAMADLLGGDK